MSCTEHHSEMIPYLNDELEPLVRARLESHLGHCARCGDLREELELALGSARSFEPELEAERLEGLVRRLSPYMQTRRSPRTLLLFWAAGAMVATLAGVVIGLSLWWGGRTEHSVQPLVELGEPSVPEAPSHVALVRGEPFAHLRWVVAEDWDGQLLRRGKHATVSFNRGFAAFSFVSGQHRRLTVETPLGRVEVVGTRFYVAVVEQTLFVGVGDGQVQVDGEAVVAGEQRSWGPERALPASVLAALDDVYLTSHHPPERAKRKTKEPEVVAAIDAHSILDDIIEAEELAEAGKLQAALAIYRECSDDSRPAYDNYRDQCRYHRARLLGFELERRGEARKILQRLAARPSEVQLEAALALCELESDPCRVRRCLDGITSRSAADSTQVEELKRRLKDRDCH